jgi:hypothetical protein
MSRAALPSSMSSPKFFGYPEEIASGYRNDHAEGQQGTSHHVVGHWAGPKV